MKPLPYLLDKRHRCQRGMHEEEWGGRRRREGREGASGKGRRWVWKSGSKDLYWTELEDGNCRNHPKNIVSVLPKNLISYRKIKCICGRQEYLQLTCIAKIFVEVTYIAVEYAAKCSEMIVWCDSMCDSPKWMLLNKWCGAIGVSE